MCNQKDSTEHFSHVRTSQLLSPQVFFLRWLTSQRCRRGLGETVPFPFRLVLCALSLVLMVQITTGQLLRITCLRCKRYPLHNVEAECIQHLSLHAQKILEGIVNPTVGKNKIKSHRQPHPAAVGSPTTNCLMKDPIMKFMSILIEKGNLNTNEKYFLFTYHIPKSKMFL